MHVLRFGNKLKEEVCRRLIFATLFNSLYLLVRLWWNILVANLATNFQDLVAKVKNLVALAPVSGAISCPARLFMNCNIVTATWLYNLTSCLLCKLYTLLLTAGSSVFTHSVKSPVNPSGGKIKLILANTKAVNNSLLQVAVSCKNWFWCTSRAPLCKEFRQDLALVIIAWFFSQIYADSPEFAKTVVFTVFISFPLERWWAVTSTARAWRLFTICWTNLWWSWGFWFSIWKSWLYSFLFRWRHFDS